MSNENFLLKFKNQIEKIEKDGINGLIKNTENSTPIDKNYYKNSKSEKNKNKNFHDEFFNKNYQNFNNHFNNNFNNNFNKNFNKNFHFPSKFDEYQNTNQISTKIYLENIKNDLNFNTPKNHLNSPKNHSNFFNNVSAGYKPYTLKEFKQMNKPVVLGKLGPNIGTKIWNEKKEKMERKKNYSNKIKKINNFKIDSIENEIKMNKKKNVEESKNFKAKNYDVIRSFTFNYKKMEEIVNKENEFEIRRNKTNKNKKMEILNEEFNNDNDNNNNINVENLFNKNNIYSQEFKNIRNSLIN
jgi:hypothetical protein